MLHLIVRPLIRLIWEVLQILLLTLGYLLMQIGKVYTAVFRTIFNIIKKHAPRVITALWVAMYAIVIVKVIKTIIRK